MSIMDAPRISQQEFDRWTAIRDEKDDEVRGSIIARLGEYPDLERLYNNGEIVDIYREAIAMADRHASKVIGISLEAIYEMS